MIQRIPSSRQMYLNFDDNSSLNLQALRELDLVQRQPRGNILELRADKRESELATLKTLFESYSKLHEDKQEEVVNILLARLRTETSNLSEKVKSYYSFVNKTLDLQDLSFDVFSNDVNEDTVAFLFHNSRALIQEALHGNIGAQAFANVLTNLTYANTAIDKNLIPKISNDRRTIKPGYIKDGNELVMKKKAKKASKKPGQPQTSTQSLEGTDLAQKYARDLAARRRRALANGAIEG